VDVTVELTSKKTLPEGSALFIAVTAGEYSDVLRQFITPANGTPLNTSTKNKQSFNFKAATINNQYFHAEKMKVVCFVQDMKTKKNSGCN